MTKAMQWMSLNWWWVGLALVALASLLNAITRHWSLATTRGGRVLLFIVEMLSVLRSRGVEAWGKLPLEDAAPAGAVRRSLSSTGLVLVLGAMLGAVSGCKATLSAQLERAHHGILAANDVALTAWHAECSRRASACGKAGDTACKALVDCQGARRTFVDAVKAIDSALATANRAAWLAGMAGVR